MARPRPYAALDVVPDPVFVVDGDLRIVDANRACQLLIGGDLDAWIGEIPLELVHPDDLPIVMSSFASVVGKEFGTPIEVRIRTAAGSFRLMEVIGATRQTGGHTHIVLSMRDLTERRRWEIASSDTELFRTVVEHAAVVLALVDGEGVVQSVSGTFNRQLGHDLSHVVGTSLADWVVDDERPQMRANLARAITSTRTTVFEATMQHADGHVIPYQFSVSNLLGDPVVKGLIVSANDISARRALEARLTQLATTDPLTGLANRSALVTYLAAQLAVPRSDRTELVVYFVDLDRFKPVNDLHGHDAGDVVLATLAQRLQHIARGGDVISRFGGDEFVVVCDQVPDAKTAARVAARIEEAISAPIAIGETAVQVFASVGFADATSAGTAEGLLAEADAAMYRTKQRRRGRPTPTTLRVAQRREIADDLVHGLAGDAFAAGLRMYFQPVVELPSARITGAEALVRWEHPRLGLLGPFDFLTVAEDAGLDLELGRWIIDHSLHNCVQWADPALTVAVNLSAAQLADPQLAEIVFDALDRHGLEPTRLCVEVTETTMLERAARGSLLPAVSTLDELKRAGVAVAIDDFGTGYSSLAHVRELPADIIKIDRTFVSGITDDNASRGIVTAVVVLAHAIGLRVIAEGVETDEQHHALIALGSDLAQGYRYGRPVSAEKFAALVDVNRRLSATPSALPASARRAS
jgi:diguanylate cyclase (GGDEF)-like protein/PAS domain S-box-containing protein